MAVITKTLQLLANTTTNPLAGELYEFISVPSTVEIGICADAAGVLAQVNAGPDTIMNEAPVTIRAINVPPIYPDDFYDDVADAGDRLFIRLRDTSGANRQVTFQLRITPL